MNYLTTSGFLSRSQVDNNHNSVGADCGDDGNNDASCPHDLLECVSNRCMIRCKGYHVQYNYHLICVQVVAQPTCSIRLHLVMHCHPVLSLVVSLSSLFSLLLVLFCVVLKCGALLLQTFLLPLLGCSI